MPSKYQQEREGWSDHQVKEDLKMWREITGGGRTLNEEQQKRYEATRDAAQKRRIILMENQG
jgi:hypothetical protein